MLQWTGESELGRPYWWDAALPEPANGALPDSCDVLVIGAGYAGLSAAIAAHDAGARVVVVDAGDPGAGASSRNGGMFGAHPRLSWDALEAKFGADVADGVFAEAAPALSWAKGLIAAEKIDCDLQQVGRIQLAWTAEHAQGQRKLADAVTAKSAVEARPVDRTALCDEIGTQHYHGGLLFPEHCGLHPAKFHRGLRRAVERRDVPLVGQAEVTALERTGTGFEARTRKGRVRADKVVLCTNGYTTRAFRWHVARVFPLPSYLIATEALPENLIGHLAHGRRM
ncbi:MAG: FAD-binding oxidoreductase, partial [Pseudomonadota bacterium]